MDESALISELQDLINTLLSSAAEDAKKLASSRLVEIAEEEINQKIIAPIGVELLTPLLGNEKLSLDMKRDIVCALFSMSQCIDNGVYILASKTIPSVLALLKETKDFDTQTYCLELLTRVTYYSDACIQEIGTYGISIVCSLLNQSMFEASKIDLLSILDLLTSISYQSKEYAEFMYGEGVFNVLIPILSSDFDKIYITTALSILSNIASFVSDAKTELAERALTNFCFLLIKDDVSSPIKNAILQTCIILVQDDPEHVRLLLSQNIVPSLMEFFHQEFGKGTENEALIEPGCTLVVNMMQMVAETKNYLQQGDILLFHHILKTSKFPILKVAVASVLQELGQLTIEDIFSLLESSECDINPMDKDFIYGKSLGILIHMAFDRSMGKEIAEKVSVMHMIHLYNNSTDCFVKKDTLQLLAMLMESGRSFCEKMKVQFIPFLIDILLDETTSIDIYADIPLMIRLINPLQKEFITALFENNHATLSLSRQQWLITLLKEWRIVNFSIIRNLVYIAERNESKKLAICILIFGLLKGSLVDAHYLVGTGVLHLLHDILSNEYYPHTDQLNLLYMTLCYLKSAAHVYYFLQTQRYLQTDSEMMEIVLTLINKYQRVFSKNTEELQSIIDALHASELSTVQSGLLKWKECASKREDDCILIGSGALQLLVAYLDDPRPEFQTLQPLILEVLLEIMKHKVLLASIKSSDDLCKTIAKQLCSSNPVVYHHALIILDTMRKAFALKEGIIFPYCRFLFCQLSTALPEERIIILRLLHAEVCQKKIQYRDEYEKLFSLQIWEEKALHSLFYLQKNTDRETATLARELVISLSKMNEIHSPMFSHFARQSTLITLWLEKLKPTTTIVMQREALLFLEEHLMKSNGLQFGFYMQGGLNILVGLLEHAASNEIKSRAFNLMKILAQEQPEYAAAIRNANASKGLNFLLQHSSLFVHKKSTEAAHSGTNLSMCAL